MIARAGDARGADECLRELAAGDLLRGMATEHVAGLMPEHAGQFRLVLEPVEQAARDEHRPAGQRERVDGLVVGEHVVLEGVVRVPGDAALDDAPAHRLDPRLRLRIRVEPAELLRHLRGRPEAERDLLLARERDVLDVARDRVHLAVAVVAHEGEDGHDHGDDEATPPHRRVTIPARGPGGSILRIGASTHRSVATRNAGLHRRDGPRRIG
jgi:hypothetical protein